MQKLKQRLRFFFAIVIDNRDFENLKTKKLKNDNKEETIANQDNVRKTTLLNALKIVNVNNFRKEKTKVIVISLIQSNDERKCEFLKTSNRINVLLNRVCHEMYIIDNIYIARFVSI